MALLSSTTLATCTIRKYRQSSLWRLAEKWHEGSTSIISTSNSSSFPERKPSQFCPHTKEIHKSDKYLKRRTWKFLTWLKDALIIMALLNIGEITVNNTQNKMHILMSGIRLLLLRLQPGKPTNLYWLTMVPPILQTHDIT